MFLFRVVFVIMDYALSKGGNLYEEKIARVISDFIPFSR